MWKSREYHNLVEAEKIIAERILQNTENAKDLAQLGRTLVAIVAQKRAMRMLPNPKPIDVGPRRTQMKPKRGDLILDVQPQPPQQLPPETPKANGA